MSAGALQESNSSSSIEPVKRAPKFVWVCAVAALLLFLTLAISFSLTRGPWWDEGLFADVAVNFRNSGHLRSSVLAPYSFDNLPEVDRYMYWQLPAYLVSLGIWFHLAPVSVQWMRMFSVMWGCVFVGSWFLFVRTLSRNETLALLTACVVALDYSCVTAASDGRMDMMCAALGQLALATYVLLRESHTMWAAAAIGFFGAASLLCHPMGAITNAFIAILLFSDRRRLRWSTVSIIALPYVGGGLLCLRYIMQAPQIFLAQAKGVSGYRVGGLLFVLRNIANDLRDRYLQFYFAPHSGTHKFKIFSVLFGLIGLLAVAANRKTRSEPLPKLLLLFFCFAYLGVAALDDLKYPYYFIYVTPIASACGAIWLYKSFHEQAFSRFIGTALLGAFLVSTIAGTGYYLHRNDFRNEYKPMVASVRSALKTGGIVMGPSELGFALGFGPPLIDDCSLGFYSGIRPKVYVMYPACRIPGYSMIQWNWSHKALAADYSQVLQSGGYAVYVRNPMPVPVR